MLTLTLNDEQGRYRVIAVDVTEESVRGATGDKLLDELFFAVKELDAVADHKWTTEEVLNSAG